MSNWNRISRGNKSLGRKSGNSGKGNFITDFRFEVGNTHNIIIPIFDIDGKKGPFLKSYAMHKFTKGNKVLEFDTKKGKKLKPFGIRTAHPYGQVDYADTLKIAEEGILCPISEMAYLQDTALWAAVNEEFGEADERKEYTDADKKKFADFIKSYKAEHFYVEQSYYKDRDGNIVSNLDNYLLVLELETEVKEVKDELGVVTKKYEVVFDENNLPKYTPKYMKLSTKRMKEIDAAVKKAVYEDELLDKDMLHSYKDFEGTEDEVTNIFGWVQYAFKYPDAESRMASGRELSIEAVKTSKSVVTEELINDFKAKQGKIYADAEKFLNLFKVELRLHTREEIIDAFTPEVRAEWNRLTTDFAETATEWEERLKDTLAEILDNSSGNNTDESEEVEVEETVEETTEEPAEEEVKEEPKNKSVAKKAKEKAAKVKDDTEDILNSILDDTL